MKKAVRAANLRPSLLGFSASGLALIAFLLGGLPPPASAQTVDVIDPTQNRNWAPGTIDHAQKMRMFSDVGQSTTQATPPIIPKLEVDPDPTGRVETFTPGVATITANNAFFKNMGTNGRTCFTCHQPQTGWTISAASARARFDASAGLEPLFRTVDGATCPSDDVSTLAARRQAYKLLTDKGLIRIGIQLPLPPVPLQFAVTVVQDPYNCTTNPVTGLTNPTTGIVSMYRRPLPSTNLPFLSAIMWDGREPSLSGQSVDATLGHAQADPNNPPTAAQQAEIVNFETGLFTAQSFDNNADVLNADGATGGPVALSLQKFFKGINDPINPPNPPGFFDPNIFDLYKPWLGLSGAGEEAYRLSVARGEEVFNTTKIKIKGVTGLNDVLGMPVIDGFCGTCHDSPNVGNHSVKAPLNIGIANAGPDAPPALDISGLPVFRLDCFAGPLAGSPPFYVTDIGRAMITGQCADIGKVKGPILRGLAARAPYFHNGSAATLMDAVNFYDQRFGIGFNDQQKQDLVKFLNTL
jgi:hypothetical protein